MLNELYVGSHVPLCLSSHVLRLELFRESPGTLEEKLWRRYKWEFPPATETKSCWWIANVDDDDQTRDARMICRSLACLRMELCETRVATTEKLRKEWEKRLENNAVAVDRLQENRDLWMSAGGPDPETLATPTLQQLDEVVRVVSTLDAMLEKHGPAGGLDSFIEEVKAPHAQTPRCDRVLCVGLFGQICLQRGSHEIVEDRVLGKHSSRPLQPYASRALRLPRSKCSTYNFQLGRRSAKAPSPNGKRAGAGRRSAARC